MNKPDHPSAFTLLLNLTWAALLDATPLLRPECGEIVAAAIAWLSLHWPA